MIAERREHESDVFKVNSVFVVVFFLCKFSPGVNLYSEGKLLSFLIFQPASYSVILRKMQRELMGRKEDSKTNNKEK